MKDLLLIISTLAIFVYCYFIMKKVDHFIENNQRLIVMESENSDCQIKIAAESPILLSSVASALEICAEANPYMDFFFISGKVDHLLKKLEDETIDILLLSDDLAEKKSGDFAFTKIPYENQQNIETASGPPRKCIDQADHLYIVWNKCVKSKNRDRVIFTLENEFCRLKKS